MNKKQRSTKAERQAAESVLRSLMEKAFKESKVEIEYGSDIPDAEHKAKVLHQALNDFRKKIRRKQTENFDLYVMVNACSIIKESQTKVVIQRKAGRFSERTQAILDVISTHPELGLMPKQTNSAALANANIGAIVADVQKGI